MPLRGLCAVNDQHRLQSKRVYPSTVVYWYDAFQAREAAPADGTTAEGVGGAEQPGPKRAISAISAGGGGSCACLVENIAALVASLHGGRHRHSLRSDDLLSTAGGAAAATAWLCATTTALRH